MNIITRLATISTIELRVITSLGGDDCGNNSDLSRVTVIQHNNVLSDPGGILQNR